MKNRLIPLIGPLIVLGAALSVTVQAQSQLPAPSAEVRAACRDDLHRLCGGVQPGGGRIKACMEAHQDELSQGCKEALQKAQAAQPPAPPTH